jgi:GTP cyclohydrolase II
MSGTKLQIVDKVFGIPLTSPDREKFFLGSYKIAYKNAETETAILYSPELENLGPAPLVRINSACFTSDIFGDQRCDCNEQLNQAMDALSKEAGLIIYHFHHEGRGAGLTTKLRVTSRMLSQNISTFEAMRLELSKQDLRQYRTAVLILNDLGITRVRLMTNNPEKIAALQSGGIEIVSTEKIFSYRPNLAVYLASKVQEQGHSIESDLAEFAASASPIAQLGSGTSKE